MAISLAALAQREKLSSVVVVGFLVSGVHLNEIVAYFVAISRLNFQNTNEHSTRESQQEMGQEKEMALPEEKERERERVRLYAWLVSFCIMLEVGISAGAVEGGMGWLGDFVGGSFGVAIY